MRGVLGQGWVRGIRRGVVDEPGYFTVLAQEASFYCGRGEGTLVFFGRGRGAVGQLEGKEVVVVLGMFLLTCFYRLGRSRGGLI